MKLIPPAFLTSHTRIRRDRLQEFLNHDFVNVSVIDARLSLRSPDDGETLAEICLQRRRIITAHISEELFVTFPLCGGKGGGKQTSGDALSVTTEINPGSDHSDVIEGMRKGAEWFQALKADESLSLNMFGNMKNAARRKVQKVIAFGFDRERLIEDSVAARCNDRVEDGDNCGGVIGPGFTDCYFD